MEKKQTELIRDLINMDVFLGVIPGERWPRESIQPQESSVRCHPDWVTCPICQCDLSGVCFDGEVPVWLDCGYCSKQCHEQR